MHDGAARDSGAAYIFAPRLEPLSMQPAEDAFALLDDHGPHTQTINLPESETAPEGGLAVTLTYDEAVIIVEDIASGGTATIEAGETSVVVNVSGVGVGNTELVASSADYGSASARYEVTGELAMSIASSDDPGTPIAPGTPLILDGAYIITVTADPAVAAESSVELYFICDDAFMTIEEPATIEGGNDSVDLAVATDAATVDAGVWGPPVMVMVSADGYAPSSSEYHIGFILGDVTDDNCVNVVDILAVRGQLGKEGSEIDPLAADINGDDKVNVLDLLTVRAGLGKGNGCP